VVDVFESEPPKPNDNGIEPRLHPGSTSARKSGNTTRYIPNSRSAADQLAESPKPVKPALTLTDWKLLHFGWRARGELPFHLVRQQLGIGLRTLS